MHAEPHRAQRHQVPAAREGAAGGGTAGLRSGRDLGFLLRAHSGTPSSATRWGSAPGPAMPGVQFGRRAPPHLS